MLDFQRTRMSCVLLSGRGGLYNSRCAEHRRDRMEGFIAPALNEQLVRNKTGRNNLGMAI
jgi:hypothetical protein